MPYKYEARSSDDESWDGRGDKIWIQDSYSLKEAEKIINEYTKTHNFNKAFNNKNENLEYTIEDVINLLQIIESNNTPSTDCEDVDLKNILIKKLTIYDLRTQLSSDTKTKMQWQKMFLDTVTTLHKLDKEIAMRMKDEEIEKKDSQISEIMKKLQKMDKKKSE